MRKNRSKAYCQTNWAGRRAYWFLQQLEQRVKQARFSLLRGDFDVAVRVLREGMSDISQAAYHADLQDLLGSAKRARTPCKRRGQK